MNIHLSFSLIKKLFYFYIDLVIDYIEHLRRDLVLERFVSQSPKELLIAPDWGLKNYEFTERMKRRMLERNTWQGRLADR